MLKLGEKSRSPFLLFLIFLFFTSAIFANENENIVFEKGDAIYSDLSGYMISGTNIPWPWWFLGHAGLYWELNLFKNRGGI